MFENDIPSHRFIVDYGLLRIGESDLSDRDGKKRIGKDADWF